mgnify:CR=1 FL=1
MGKNTWSRPDREALNRVLANNKSNLEGIVLRLAWKQGLSREEIRQLPKGEKLAKFLFKS